MAFPRRTARASYRPVISLDRFCFASRCRARRFRSGRPGFGSGRSFPRKYELAMEAYRRADKLSHHSCAQCYLKISEVERTAGEFDAALDDTKKALKAA